MQEQNIRNLPKPKIKNKKFNIGIYSLIIELSYKDWIKVDNADKAITDVWINEL